MSRHYQVEAHMSMTGSNADNWILVKPSEQGVAIAHLYNILTGSNVPTTGLNDKAKKALNNVASELKKAAGKSLVISGSTMVSEQMMINAINQSLGNSESTVSTSNYSLQRQGNLKEIFALLEELKSGSIDLIIFKNSKPINNTPFVK